MTTGAAAPAMRKVGQLLYTLPPKVRTAQPPHSPCAVMLYGWMGAEIKYVSKYALPYTELFPHATILVQLSNTRSAFLQWPPGGKEDTEKALNILRAASARAQAAMPHVRPTVVFHSFSNGGIMPFTTLLDRGCQSPTDLPEPLAYIMDCSPGNMSGKVLADAMGLVPTQNSILHNVRVRALRMLVTNFFNLQTACSHHLGKDDFLEHAKNRLNKTQTWAWGHEPERLPARLYLYTLADRFIDPRDVATHGAQAQATFSDRPAPVHQMEGIAARDVKLTDDPVQFCEWKTALHCALARHTPEVYTEAIRQFLEGAMATRHTYKAKL